MFRLAIAFLSCDPLPMRSERSPIPMKISLLRIFVVAIVLSVGVASPALAYLDPSTGNFILQTLIAGAFGAYLFFKVNMKAIRDRLQGLFGSRKPDPEPDPSEQAKE
jgi:hypothetical protein